MRALYTSCLVLALLLISIPTALAQDPFAPIPDDEDFVPFYCGDIPSWDPVGDDQGGHRDIVGDETRPAVLRAATSTHLYLRMRLDGDPRQGDRLATFGWGYLFDTPPLNFEDGDPDTNTYDYLLHLEGGGAHMGILTFYSNEGQLVLDDPTAPAAGDIMWQYEHDDPDPLWHVKEAPGEPFGNEPTDYLLTMAIHWDDLTPHGITPDGVTVLWTGTTTSNQAIDRDFACHDGSGDDLQMSDLPYDGQPLDPSTDQCADGTATCDENALCINESDGGYSCECADGYEGDGFDCEPVDDGGVTITTEDGMETDDDQPTIEGTAEPGEEVEIVVDGEVVDTVTADEDGNWSWSPDESLDDGDYTITARPPGGGDEEGDEITITVDTSDDGDRADLVVHYPTDGDTVSGGTVTVSGTAEPGDEIVVIVDGEVVGTTTADEDGNWSVEFEADEEGDHEIVVTATDGDGNTTTFEGDFTVTDVYFVSGGAPACAVAPGSDLGSRPAPFALLALFGLFAIRRPIWWRRGDVSN